jgi:hypothetical protein
MGSRMARQAEARATLAAIGGLLAALLAAGATNVVGLAGATLFAVCGALPVALCARAEVKPARLHPAFPAIAAAAMLVFACVRGERELEALAIAQPVREPPPRGSATAAAWQATTAARAETAWRAARRWPGEETLWRLACDASLAASDADTGAAGRDRRVDRGGRREARAGARAAARGERRASRDRVGHACARVGLGGTRRLGRGAVRARVRTGARGWLAPGVAHPIRAFASRRRARARVRPAARRALSEAALGHSLSGAALLLLGRVDEARAALLRARAARWEEDAGEQRAALERLLQQFEASGAPPPPRP